MAELSIERLSLSFGGLAALSDVDIAVPAGEIRGIIGPNGAGKTTLLNVVSGLVRPTEGEIRLDGQPLTRLKASEVAARGVGRTFQTSLLFKGMTVLENVMAGMHQGLRASVLGAAIGLPGVLREERQARERAREALAFVGMLSFAERDGASLSFGQQRLVEIARSLVAEPKVLLLDEPAVGLSPPRVAELDELLRRIRDKRGITIIMVEHVIRLVMGVCDRITVLNSGRKIADGAPDAILADPFVKEAYLGKSPDADRA
ncbi:ABC transporter ATP-binding protein [Azospirillum brasilense]|uniref:ABC transporter ATP-binding protein n=1 Tax=Azospirillum brasilense TaxID=192 RepID=UPI000E6A6172|nr:ABC transporter ATP-binding protein [Azospirillum brasilense]NUB24381.1 ATP-binding cassette domain-containing protein [Azospirillum brasilense]NUB30788.1 ATP-binding cassette domain-containing protein [Azospirillum brasilense]RIW02597.1 ABC transporter ATP-binding protein [Azospirillum brasilense]